MAALEIKDTKRLALKFYETCPTNNKTAFDAIWHPLVKFVEIGLVSYRLSDIFVHACLTGRWKQPNGAEVRLSAVVSTNER